MSNEFLYLSNKPELIKIDLVDFCPKYNFTEAKLVYFHSTWNTSDFLSTGKCFNKDRALFIEQIEFDPP